MSSFDENPPTMRLFSSGDAHTADPGRRHGPFIVHHSGKGTAGGFLRRNYHAAGRQALPVRL
jgi:hypothetical protein